MFYSISNATKKRIVQVFQEIFLKHPIFNKVQVVTKFPEKERFKSMLLVRSASGTAQRLSMDNFIKTQIGYSTLANLKGVVGNSIEWVRDDFLNDDKMSAPGFYIVSMVEEKEFVVSPFQLVEEELEITFIKQHDGAVLKYLPINPKSEVIYSEDGFEFKSEIDYTIDYETGEILFTNSVREYEPIKVEYQVIGEERGPFKIELYQMNNTAIPGVVLAFGDRLRKGDEQVVVVEKDPRDVAKIYGGRWQMSIDLIGISQDPDQQERLVDYAISMFWAEWQDKLVEEGINIYDFSLSGESEDLEVDIPEEYNFTGGISFSIETDWQLSVPLITTIRRISLAYGEESYKDMISNNDETQYELKQFDRKMITGSRHQNGLQIVPSFEPIVLQPNLKVNTRKY